MVRAASIFKVKIIFKILKSQFYIRFSPKSNYNEAGGEDIVDIISNLGIIITLKIKVLY